MRLSRSLLSVHHLCEQCCKNSPFVSIQVACALTDVSRSTIYNWMDRELIHWLEAPSGRRMICQESLSFRVPELRVVSFPQKFRPKVSRTV